MPIWKRAVVVLVIVLAAGSAVYALDALARRNAWPRGYVTAAVTSCVGLTALATGLLAREPPAPLSRRELIRGGALLLLLSGAFACLEYLSSSIER